MVHWWRRKLRAVMQLAGSDKEPYQESLELGRFVLRDEVPAKGESARSCIGCNNSALAQAAM
jgi:hypothetical protein